MQIKIADIINDSIVDGPGIRMTVFVQGCPHRCQGCHNPATHDFEGGRWMDTDEILKKAAGNPLLDGVTFSGGEPFCQAEPLTELAKDLKARGLNIICYTGYTFEELMGNHPPKGAQELLAFCDCLIDGKFMLQQRDLTLRFRGSQNQRILDVPKSLAQGRAVETEL